MTDNDIIKALKYCISIGNNCPKCPYFTLRFKGVHCKLRTRQDALALINRQKAEIESLQKTEYILPARHCGKTKMVRIKLDEIKAEAIKEFAERLKKEVDFVDSTRKLKQTIDNLVKEMVGERE